MAFLRPLWLKLPLGLIGLLLVLAAVAAGFAAWRLVASRPQLEGTVRAPGLSAPVEVARDADGVPTLTGASREDLAWALGYLHAQERFFQMDLMRRAAAGELAELVGAVALPLDRETRRHRFRTRSRRALNDVPVVERRLLEAYGAGVDQGLAALGAAPFEYAILRTDPQPWRLEDTFLAGLAMYLDLQESDGRSERRLELVRAKLGPEMADFLYPAGTSWDAALDGSHLPEPPMPMAVPGNRAPVPAAGAEDAALPGSNGWGVGGALTAHGAAMIANDMHLGLRIPNSWYRVRLILKTADGVVMDAVGVTLPGTPNLIAGSNGRIAWGFTNSYIDTGDAVVVEAAEGGYRTPDGIKPFTLVEERLCGTAGECETLVVKETVWGPVIGTDSRGRDLAWRWVAHDPGAVAASTLLELERAGSVAEAIGIAHKGGVPQQNLVVGDRDGNLAWTIIGRVPRRIGHDGRLPVSWADGRHGWDGYLPPEEVPVILNPATHRIWTANARMLGGDALTKLGDGGYAVGSRAAQIRDGLLARDRFTEADHLAIQLDERGLLLVPWQEMLLRELEARTGNSRLAALLPPIRDWGGRAVPDSVGYRLVRTFRAEAVRRLYEAFAAPVAAVLPRQLLPAQAEGPALRLMTERPPGLVPPGAADWADFVDQVLAALLAEVEGKTGGDVALFTWGEQNRSRIAHPLSAAVPGLAMLTDPEDVGQAGDIYQPRVAAPRFGASERFVVAPGHEAEGIFHMPGGQSGHPLAPYYLGGHADWVAARPTPFLPGPAKWVLHFKPADE